MSLKLKRIKIDKKDPILSAQVSTSDSVFKSIVDLYFHSGWTIVDSTWGKGVFWKQVDDSQFNVIRSDIWNMDGINVQSDALSMPYKDNSLDAVVYDPPYLHVGGLKTLKFSLDGGYRNKQRGFAGKDKVVNMYKTFIDNVDRPLKKGGILVIKYMMQVESSWVRASTVEVFNHATEKGYKLLDWFINVNPTVPLMRHDYQMHSRRNYSDWLILYKNTP